MRKIVIIGAGIIGLTLARELSKLSDTKITILEKEKKLGVHASGRNSGVLHSGIYYTSDSQKAKFCLDGNRLMASFCKRNDLSYEKSGKVIIAKNKNEIPMIYELDRRAQDSGASVEIIDGQQLSDIEPNAITEEVALYSPETAVFDPNEVVKEICEDLLKTGNVKIKFNSKVNFINSNFLRTNKDEISYDFVVNCAGVFADVIAKFFGIGSDYSILPFKGTYKKLHKSKSHLVNGSIYPVPDLNNPFLGVHLTKNVKGEILIGPSAIPAFGRENYRLFDDLGFESFSILLRDASLFVSNKSFRNAALTEPKYYFNKYIHQEIEKMVTGINIEDIEDSQKVGIRPQLVNKKDGDLVMDFVVDNTENSYHILNSISPAFTCSMAFSKFISKEIVKLL